jgi:hypothetical protein
MDADLRPWYDRSIIDAGQEKYSWLYSLGKDTSSTRDLCTFTWNSKESPGSLRA